MLSSEFAGGSPGWMPRGACQGQDPELFFPIAANGPALAQVIAAKAVCFRCAVRAACLSYALATGQSGIWGGTTQEERHVMRRSSGPPAVSTARPRVPRAEHQTITAIAPASDPCTPTDGNQAGSIRTTAITVAVATRSGTGPGCSEEP